MLSEILWVLGPTAVVSGVVFFPVIKENIKTLLTPALKDRVDKNFSLLLLILAKLQEGNDWHFYEKGARYPKDGSAYKFRVDLDSSVVTIPGERDIQLTPYWRKQFSVAIAKEVADQNMQTIMRHLYPNESVRLLK